MKRYLVWGTVGLLMLALAGMASATVWQDALYPNDYVTTNIFNLSIDPNCTSTMGCAVYGATLPHITMVTYGMGVYFLHQADLSYGQTSQQTGTIYLNQAVLHWSLPSANDLRGYSKFKFEW